MKFLFLIVFGGGGLACAIAGAYLLVKRIELVKTGTKTQGVVVGHETSWSKGKSGNTMMYAERVEFKDGGGNLIDFTSNTSSSSADFGVGENVEVLYQHSNPRNAMINSFKSFWLGPIVLTCFGLIFLAAGIFAFRKIEDSFGSAFFAHSSIYKGRYKQIEVSVTDVKIHDQDGQIAVSFSLRGSDPKSGQLLEWNSPPRSYSINRVPLDRDAALQLRNQPLRLTYDPNNTSDYYFDIFRRGATRVSR